MASEWPPAKLSDVAAINPRRKVRKGESVPFIEMAALPVSGRDVSMDDIEMRLAKAAGSHFQNGDTLLARITPCLENGKTAQVNNLPDNVVGEGSTEFIVLCGHDSEDDDYIYYLTRSPDFRDFAIARMEGTSGRQRVAWQPIAGYQFNLPPPEIRRESAELLASLDDRIQSLRQTNATLEAIAQALFKSWFVDFDPVRAKAEGREPEGMGAAIAALFPGEFEDSEIGPIPKGWRAGSLVDLVELKYGKALKASERRDGAIPVYGSGGITGVHDKLLVEGPTIIVGRKGTVGALYWQSGPCFPIDTVFYANPKESLHYSYYAMRRMGLEHLNTDAAVPGLNRDNAYRQPVVIPPTELLQEWDVIAESLRARIDHGNDQIETLQVLRDTLLPRLISGKLRLPEAGAHRTLR